MVKPHPSKSNATRHPFPGSSRRGLSVIWVILTCSLAFGSVLFALYHYTDWQDRVAEVDQRKAMNLQLDQDHVKLLASIDLVTPFTGLKRTSETEMPCKEAEEFLKARQQACLTDVLKLQEKQLSVATIENCVEVTGRILDAALADRDRAKAELERRKNAVKTTEKRAPEIAATKQRQLDEITKKTQESIEKRTREESSFTPEVQKMEEQTKKENEEREAVEKKHKEEMLRLENEISDLKRRLEEVKQREVMRYDIIEIHGEVIEHDIEGKFAFINIGSAHRVVPGLRFHAALPGNFGQMQYKGEVEVKRVWPHRSQVHVVVAYDPSRPILKGDVLINPLFDIRRPKVVAFSGETASRKLRMSVNEATRRILEIQSVVKPETTVDLDFLITTDAFEGDKNYLKAVELQIPIASASDVLKFLGH